MKQRDLNTICDDFDLTFKDVEVLPPVQGILDDLWDPASLVLEGEN